MKVTSVIRYLVGSCSSECLLLLAALVFYATDATPLVPTAPKFHEYSVEQHSIEEN